MLIIGACSHAWEKGLINKIFRVCQMGLVILCLDVCGHISSLCTYFGKSMISHDNIEGLPLCTSDSFIHVVIVLFDVSRWPFEIVKHIMFWCQRFISFLFSKGATTCVQYCLISLLKWRVVFHFGHVHFYWIVPLSIVVGNIQDNYNCIGSIMPPLSYNLFLERIWRWF